MRFAAAGSLVAGECALAQVFARQGLDFTR
jgi:hypothetical protein